MDQNTREGFVSLRNEINDILEPSCNNCHLGNSYIVLCNEHNAMMERNGRVKVKISGLFYRFAVR